MQNSITKSRNIRSKGHSETPILKGRIHLKKILRNISLAILIDQKFKCVAFGGAHPAYAVKTNLSIKMKNIFRCV